MSAGLQCALEPDREVGTERTLWGLLFICTAHKNTRIGDVPTRAGSRLLLQLFYRLRRDGAATTDTKPK